MGKPRKAQSVNSTSDSYYLDNILSNIPEYVFWKDLDSVYVRCNKNFATLAGFNSIEDIVGKTDYDLPWAPFTKDVYLKEDKLIIESKLPLQRRAVPLTGADGIDRVIRVSKAPLLNDEGEVVGILGVFHDVTELSETQTALIEQMEKTEEAYRSKTEFLSITTHEVRNPVGNIVMFDGFLKKNIESLRKLFIEEVFEVLEPQQREKLEEVIQKAEENIGIIGEEATKTLDYLKSLGEIHRFQITGVNCRFTSIITDNLIPNLIKDTRPYNLRKINIKSSVDPSVPPRIEIDNSNVYEALKTILINAIRFSHENGLIKIHIANAGNKLKITIRDFGVGIAVSQINDLFGTYQDFVQDPEAAIYRKPSLKLTLAKMMVEASKGELKIQKEEQGTCVTLLIPYKSIQGTKRKKKKTAFEEFSVDENIQSSDKIIREILIVEDDALFQKAEKMMFEGMGHSVLAVSTGEAALNAVIKKEYDIIFLDITLPDMSGMDVMKKIRKMKHDMRIIVITSHANTQDVERFEEIGATLVLTKPITIEQFQDCLKF